MKKTYTARISYNAKIVAESKAEVRDIIRDVISHDYSVRSPSAGLVTDWSLEMDGESMKVDSVELTRKKRDDTN